MDTDEEIERLATMHTGIHAWIDRVTAYRQGLITQGISEMVADQMTRDYHWMLMQEANRELHKKHRHEAQREQNREHTNEQ